MYRYRRGFQERFSSGGELFTRQRTLLLGRIKARAPGLRGREVETRVRHEKERTMADRVGKQLGNYRLVSLLGRGGYAEVYLGQHVRFNMQAAVKVLHAHLSG